MRLDGVGAAPSRASRAAADGFELPLSFIFILSEFLRVSSCSYKLVIPILNVVSPVFAETTQSEQSFGAWKSTMPQQPGEVTLCTLYEVISVLIQL